MPLHRSRRHKIIAGVCGGIADWLGWRPTTVRLLYVLLSLCSAGFPGTIVYILLWIVLRKAPNEPAAPE
jgi:phage shock protein C